MQQDTSELNKKILENQLELTNVVKANSQTIENVKHENVRLELQVLIHWIDQECRRTLSYWGWVRKLR
jgi:hypothetical protein